MSEDITHQLEQKFEFASGKLHVRYLGLPLLPLHMGKENYNVINEKIKTASAFEKIASYLWQEDYNS